MVPQDCSVVIVAHIDDTWPDTLQRSHADCTFQLSDAPDDAFGGDTQVKPQRIEVDKRDVGRSQFAPGMCSTCYCRFFVQPIRLNVHLQDLVVPEAQICQAEHLLSKCTHW